MKNIVLIFITLLTISTFACPASANKGRLDASAGIGMGYYYLYPKDIQLQGYYKGAFTWRAFMRLKSESGLSIAGEMSLYTEANMSSTAPSGTSLTIIPVTVSVAYHPIKNSAISPYFGGGIGFYNINESDPNFTYLQTNKFGKHIFVGTDIYITDDSIFKAELRQTFIEAVNSTFYYQANFGGLTAMASLAIEWNILGNGEKKAAPESLSAQQREASDAETQALIDHLKSMQSFYAPQRWDQTIYPTGNAYYVILGDVSKTQEQIDEIEKKKKNDEEQKRKLYLEEKLKKRQLKQDSSINP